MQYRQCPIGHQVTAGTSAFDALTLGCVPPLTSTDSGKEMIQRCAINGFGKIVDARGAVAPLGAMCRIAKHIDCAGFVK